MRWSRCSRLVTPVRCQRCPGPTMIQEKPRFDMKRLSSLHTKSLIALAALGALFAAAPAADATPTRAKGEQMIVFAGGCFWGIQSVFEHTKGVTSAVSG